MPLRSEFRKEGWIVKAAVAIVQSDRVEGCSVAHIMRSSVAMASIGIEVNWRCSSGLPIWNLPLVDCYCFRFRQEKRLL